MKKNKIIIFAYDFYPNNGGISRLLKGIYDEFLKRNITVKVITCAHGEADVNIIRINHIFRGTLDFYMRQALRKIYQEGDIILTDTWHPAASLALTITQNVYMLAHGAELMDRLGVKNNTLWKKYRQFIIRKVRGIIANSQYTQSLVQRISDISNSIALPLAVDSQRFFPKDYKKYDDDKLRICSLARLERYKGHDFLLHTIASLPQEYRAKITLDIGGLGRYKRDLECLANDLGLSDSVSFKGFIPEELLPDFYQQHDLFILLTREDRSEASVEGFGIVFIEAQACGLPVIGTNAGGIPDAIDDGATGWLINQDDTTQLRKLLMKLVDNRGILSTAGVKARNYSLCYHSWNIYMEHLTAFMGIDRLS